MSKILIIEMPDKSEWAVPVEIIARNRAAHYAEEFDGDVERSLKEDTWPLFEQNDYEITDWASNNMNWSDFEAYARQIHPPEINFERGWSSGEKRIETSPQPPEGFRELAMGEIIRPDDSRMSREKYYKRVVKPAGDWGGEKVKGTESVVFLRRIEGGAA